MRDRLWGEDKAPRALCAVGQGVYSRWVVRVRGCAEHPFTTISHGQETGPEYATGCQFCWVACPMTTGRAARTSDNGWETQSVNRMFCWRKSAEQQRACEHRCTKMMQDVVACCSKVEWRAECCCRDEQMASKIVTQLHSRYPGWVMLVPIGYKIYGQRTNNKGRKTVVKT